MLYYQYLWLRFVLRNPASASFGGWLWTSLAIAAPWNFCFICIGLLGAGVRNGSVQRDLCLRISMLVEVLMLSAYSLAPEIHRLTRLGVLN